MYSRPWAASYWTGHPSRAEVHLFPTVKSGQMRTNPIFHSVAGPCWCKIRLEALGLARVKRETNSGNAAQPR